MITEDPEISADDPTPMMMAWAKDAQEFGIPFQTQKGLMFLTAFGLRASYQPSDLAEWIDFIRELSSKISHEPPHISTADGGDFYDQNFSPLLTELAERVLGDQFSPRQISIRGNSFAAWEREDSADQLPSCLGPELWQLAEWDQVMTVFCEKIGKDINMDLEGAYLAGFLYFDSCYSMDTEATMQVARLVSHRLPPKYLWFRHILNFDADLAAQGNPIQKLLDCFLGDVASQIPLLYQLVAFLNDQLHYEEAGVKSQDVWDASTLDFTSFVVQQRDWFDAETPDFREAIPGVVEALLEMGFASPPACSDISAAVEAVAKAVLERWGYSLEATDGEIPADGWMRRCCVVYTCVVFSVLDSDWNKRLM